MTVDGATDVQGGMRRSIRGPRRLAEGPVAHRRDEGSCGSNCLVQAGRECGGGTCKGAPAAVMSASGVVAGHRVKLSTQVSRQWEPQEYDRGSATLVRVSSNLVETGAEGPSGELCGCACWRAV